MDTSVAQLKDGVDNIHSGVIKALQAATGENRGIDGFDLTQSTNSGTTRFIVGAGKVLRNGKLVSVSGANLDTTTGTIQSGSSDWYGVIVVCDGTESGETANTLKWRPGTVTGHALRNTSATVAELKGGDIPIIVAKIDAASSANVTTRKHQYLGYEQSIREFSAINAGTERLRINKEGTLTHTPSSTAYSLTLPSASGTIALTSDISNLVAGSLAAGAVTEPKLASNSVSTIKIEDDAVTFAKMQDLSAAFKLIGTGSASGQVSEVSIATGHISDNAVTNAKINDNAVTSAKIANGTIVSGDLASGAVTLDKITDIAQDRILARIASGSGDVQAITPTQLRTLINVANNADVTGTANVKAALGGDLGNFTLGESNDSTTVAGNLTVAGDLTISGTTTTIDSNNVNIGDRIITLNSDLTGTPPASEDAGIEVERGSQSNKTLVWDESAGRWTVGSETFVAGTFIGNLTGTVSSATALANARNFSISGDVTASAVSFDGTGNVALATSLAAGVVDTEELAGSAVETAKIANLNITTDKIANQGVTSAKIANNAVISAKIANDAVLTAHIADDQITAALMANNAVGTAVIVDSAVTNAKLAGSISQSKISNLTSDLAGKQATLTFGTGLSNSGATINVDISELSVENGIDKDNDHLMFNDNGTLRKTTLNNIFSKISESNLPSLPASKITSGTFAVARIPNIATSKITSGTFSTSRIADNAVTFDKVQDVASGVLLGRTTNGTGGIETISTSAARTFLNVDTAGTDNSTNVTLTGSRNYLTLNGQQITVGEIDISDDTNLVAGTNISLSGDTLNVDTDLSNYSNSNSGFLTAHPTISNAQSNTTNTGRTYIQNLTFDSNGHVVGVAVATETVTDTQYSVGDGGLSQNNFTDSLKSKLDGVAADANNFILQHASASTLGGIKVGSNLTMNSGTGVLSADTQSDINFTSALNTKLAGIATGATAGADWTSNVTNRDGNVTNAHLAGSIANAKLANSSVTINGSTVALGNSITLTTANVAEGSNLYYTDERVDDRVNALLIDGEGITTTYNDATGELTIDAEDATASNKGVASFASSDFDVSSGAVSVKSGGITNAQLAGSIANDKLLAIAQGKVTGLTAALNAKIESLTDLSVTASASEINILDGVTGVSSAEISHLNGVTSSIQTQLDTKQAAGSYLSTSSSISDLSDVSGLDTSLTNIGGHNTSIPTTTAVKSYVDVQIFDAIDTQYTLSAIDGATSNAKKLALDGIDGSRTTIGIQGVGDITISRNDLGLTIDSVSKPISSVAFSGNTLTITKTDATTVTATIPDATTSAHGLMTDDQFDKLAGIETAATADQTAAEIRTLVESASNSNVFTDDDHTKLNAIETGATADQTASEIRTLVEAATDSNVFTDADHTKLNGIATSANNYSISSDLLDEDNMVSNSATKVASQQSIKTFVENKVSDLVNSAPGTLDTLGELATALQTNDSDITGITTALGNRLRIDINNQTISATEQSNALTNLGITATLAEINILDDGLSQSDIPTLNASKITAGTFTTTRIPNLNASKITAGSFSTARIPSLAASKITSGTFPTARIADDAVTVDKISGLTDLGSGIVISSSERTKLSGIETSADVTDTANVTAAGALMDSEITNLSEVKAFDSSDYATAAQGTTADAALPKSGGTMSGNITFNSTQQFDGRDLSVDGAKLDNIESSADVTDATNVAAAGAIMDGDFTSNGLMKRTGAGTYTIDASTYLTAHPTISGAASNTSNSGRTYIQNLEFDSNGHVTSVSTASETLANTDTQLSQAQVRDFAGGMFTGNTETFITSTYDTSSDTVELTVPVKDEDDMTSNSATHLATQQSIKAYVDTEVAGLVDSAPGALNTLNELAAAINDDATFSATVTTALGNRLRVDTASQGLSGTEQSNARTNLNVDVAGTDNSVPVTLANTNYLSLSGQQITGGTIPISSGGTGATSAAAARTALGVDAAGTQVSTDVTLVTSSHDYLSISGQAITLGQIDISDDTNLTAGTGLTLSGDTLNVNAAQSGITSVGTLSSLTVSGDVTVDTNTFKIDSTNNRVGIGTATPGYKLQVEGSFAAQTKSFVIPHPTQEGKTLQHGSLEGPEHGVYHRGRITGSDNMGVSIALPEYWTELVDEDTISVQLTANGDFQMLYVEKIEDNRVFVANAADEGIDCFYLIHGERKDVGKMEVEY